MDEFDQSYNQQNIALLKQEVTVSKQQLIQIVSSQILLINKIKQLNNQAINCINKQLFYQSIVYLNQAQKILQYAASLGKTIDRFLIVTILHNQACAYQRLWQLQKSADYIEGIIYNISTFLDSQSYISFTSKKVINIKQQIKYSNMIQNKQKLAIYYLQYCAASSQLKKHQNSLNSAYKALQLLKTVCNYLFDYQSQVTIAQLKMSSSIQIKNILFDLSLVRQYREQEQQLQILIQGLMNKAKSCLVANNLRFLQKGSLNQQQKAILNQFSIGSVMQLQTLSQIDNQGLKWVEQHSKIIKKIQKALLISITQFTLATQLRMIAFESNNNQINNNYNNILKQMEKLSIQYKRSLIHHLTSIIITAQYAYQATNYFKHLLTSFQNNYHINLIQQAINTSKEPKIHLQINLDQKITFSKQASVIQNFKELSHQSYNKQLDEGKKNDKKIKNTKSPQILLSPRKKFKNKLQFIKQDKYKKIDIFKLHKKQKSKSKLTKQQKSLKNIIDYQLNSRSKSRSKKLTSFKSQINVKNIIKTVHTAKFQQQYCLKIKTNKKSSNKLQSAKQIKKNLNIENFNKSLSKCLNDPKSPKIFKRPV